MYEHEEDFFFRTVHLGSECWAFVVHNRVSIAQQLAEEGQWHLAASRIIQVAHTDQQLQKTRRVCSVWSHDGSL